MSGATPPSRSTPNRGSGPGSGPDAGSGSGSGTDNDVDHGPRPLVPRFPKPAALMKIPASRHALIEASAGTGKTHTLEHLFVDLILTEGASVREILVVTFTDKAASELRRRIRERLRGLSVFRETDTLLAPEQCWVIDEEARRRLETAVVELDTARIETIHAFCQSVLLESPFSSGGSFTQELVDERRIHARAFREVLERRLLSDSRHRVFLTAWIEESGRSLGALEELLFEARRAKAVLHRRWDAAGFGEAVRALRGLAAESAPVPGRAGGRVAKRLEALERALEAENDAVCLARLERLDLASSMEHLPPASDALRALADAAVGLSSVLVERFGPLVDAQLRRFKRDEGLFDYDDMLERVARSLRAAPELASSLRSRFGYLLIDEFQDTDRNQWQIFRDIFVGPGDGDGDDAVEHPVRLVGDPKQAIYGFRGADVQVYLDARKMVSSAGALVHLAESYRATPRLVEALNLVFDPGGEEPVFDGVIRPAGPLRAGDSEFRLVDAGGDEAPAVVLLEHRGRDRAPLARWIAEEVHRVLNVESGRLSLARDGKRKLLGPEDVFVLTRTYRESLEVAEALRSRSIPHSFYRQDGLFQSREASHWLDLLAAIEDPSDRSKRFRAWLTPFFGLTLEDLQGCDDVSPEHALVGWLADWSSLAERQEYAALFEDVLDRTGILRRELFYGGSARPAVNYRHVVDVLLERLEGQNLTIGELRRSLSRHVSGRSLPSGRESNVMRRDSERAVSITTIHAAKGLEAALVFVYAFSAGRPSQVQVYSEGGERRMHVGRKSAAPDAVRQAVEREEKEENQRLLYVALTRAKARLYLPLLDPAVARRSCYRQLNARLTKLRGAFPRVEVPPSPPAAAERLESVGLNLNLDLDLDLEGFRSSRDWEAPHDRAPFESLKRRHCGLELTSYSRIKALGGGYHPPALLGEHEPGNDGLPGGAATGTMLHEILETVDFTSLRGSENLEAWRTRDDVAALVGSALRRRGIARAHRSEVERYVYLALTTPVSVGQHRLQAGLAGADRALREVAFVFPHGSGRAEGDGEGVRPLRGFVEGTVDLLFEDRGLTYFCDWKSDVLPVWTADAVREHIERNYRVQIKLYTLAVLKMLAVSDEESYSARFGGALYCFLRGLPDLQPHFERPSWKDVVGWAEEYRVPGWR